MKMIELIPEEDLKILNRRLLEKYGCIDDQPNFRLVWSEGLMERRIFHETPEGLQLASPEIKEVRKYGYIWNRYVLESLCVVPEGTKELTTQLSYEPIWTFDKDKQYVRPSLEACCYVVETVLRAMELQGYTKYPDPASEAGYDEARIQNLYDELFGNESDITDALSTREGVGYGPGSSPNSTTPAHKIN